MHIRRIEKLHRKLLLCTTHIVKFLNLQGLEIVTMYLVLSCRQIIYLTGPTLPWVARSEIEILGDSKELENVLTLSWPFVLNLKPNLPWNIEQTNQMNLAFYKDNYKISVNTAVYVHAAVFTMCWNPFWRGSILFFHAHALGLLLNLHLH